MTVTVENQGLRDLIRARYIQVADDATEAMLVDLARDAPRDKGDMTNNMTIDAEDGDSLLVRTIGAPDAYARWQDEGTGVYIGQDRIRPTRSKFLHFVAKDGTEVFVRSVKGTPPTRWWTSKVTRFAEYVRAALG